MLEKYHSEGHLEQMNFEDKRAILHFLFEGKYNEGTPYGVYVSRKGNCKEQKNDYFLYGKIIGVRTLSGDNPNFQEDNNNYKTTIQGLTYLSCV